MNILLAFLSRHWLAVGIGAVCAWLFLSNAALRGELAGERQAFADYRLAQVGVLNKAVTVALEAEREAAAIAHAAEIAAVEANREIEIVTETIIREVEVLITPDVDLTYPIPNAWVLLHDAGANGSTVAALTGSPSSANAAASEFTMSQTAELLARNYGVCRQNAARLEQLQKYSLDVQAWWRTVEAAWPTGEAP